ncbi:UDP-N-acetylmuramoyl-L-alanyl-D-glutamate--2,6-diaminopimelate ligase [Fundicoccus sp. Sow4_D5]|uniref:UDP-N-acetylmuramoyl-L-alanyl-D-glutamate--2, 6-diaminopimelate ligase n=1 Tax=Fundicoccus sp. Sow4_D5 TaxID=3438782 RepID=UPI003F928464
MEVKELVSVLSDTQVLGKDYSTLELSSIVNDTRKVKENSCFIAIKGEQFDGHQALASVVKEGAKLLIVEDIPDNWQEMDAMIVKVTSTYRAQAILANKFYNMPSQQLNLVAVTGTNGKTTTSTMISDLLMALGRKTGLVGTIHYKVDQTYYPAVNTTPNALELQSLYAEMLSAGCKDAIIEASSHALSLGRIWYSDVDCAIFTNLTREHLDFHKTMEHYAYAKSLLFAQMGQQFHSGKPRIAIINLEDPYHEVMIAATAADIVTYSLSDTKATAYVSDIESQRGTTTFVLHYAGKAHTVKLPMLGEYNISNYLAAFLTMTIYYGFPVEDVLIATSEFRGVTGRMQSIDEGQDFTAIVDFAHTSDALERVLQELSSRKTRKLIALTGHSGGNRDSGARPELGDLLFKYADEIVFTADNPRFEGVDKIVSELVQQHTEKPYIVIEKREEAIEYAITHAGTDDIILFAGKGGEAYQIIKDEYIPYDEVAVVRNTLKKQLTK